MAFKEKERLMRPSASKRRYIAVESESDVESDLDLTLNQSQDSSCLDETLNESFGSRGASYWKQRALAAEAKLKAEKLAREADNAKWETKWKKEVGPLENLFRRIYGPSRGNSGRQFKYGKELQALLQASHLDEIDDGSVKEAYLQQIERYEQAFTIEEAIENFTASH